jgi:hypothetical protein
LLHALVGASLVSSVDVDVVIVNWNTRDYVEACIRSVFENARDITFRVFVVDNASADGSAEMVRSKFPEVRLIANATNLGFAAANNQAFREADARYLLLLNPDTVVLDDVIQNVVRLADTEPDVAVVGCQVLGRADKIERSCFRFPSPLNLFLLYSGLERAFPGSPFFGRASMASWDRKSRRDVDVVVGVFMLVRSEAVAEVGLMDEDYFVYAEEADWCYRFHRAGWRCLFAPVGTIRHEEGGARSTSQDRVRMYVQLQKSLLIFHRKNRGWFSWLCAKSILGAAMLVRAAFWRVRATLGGQPELYLRAQCAEAALKFHLFGIEPRK